MRDVVDRGLAGLVAEAARELVDRQACGAGEIGEAVSDQALGAAHALIAGSVEVVAGTFGVGRAISRSRAALR